MISDNDLSAIAIIGGAVIGAGALFATTWLNHYAQERARLIAQSMARREQLYEEFIDEASRLYSDALTNELGDLSKLVRIYAALSKMRLSAPGRVLTRADEIMTRLLELYRTPKTGFDLSQGLPKLQDMDLLRAFSDACRDDLHQAARESHKKSSRTIINPEDLISRAR